MLEKESVVLVCYYADCEAQAFYIDEAVEYSMYTNDNLPPDYIFFNGKNPDSAHPSTFSLILDNRTRTALHAPTSKNWTYFGDITNWIRGIYIDYFSFTLTHHLHT
jgi:hypothetical protein